MGTLSKLPMWIVKKSSNYYYDSRTGKYIHVSNIEKYVPKQEIKEVKQDWTRGYYGN
jgi:hypothetical protein